MLYTFTKSPCDILRLENEIQESSIIIALSHIDLIGDELNIHFNDVLPQADETTLNNIVSAHTGEPWITESVQEVVTQEEKNDKVLKLACGLADVVNGSAIISITVPSGGRYAAGGYCFTDAWTMGDKVTKVQVTHPDYGVVKTYHDSDAPEANQGWLMYPAHNNSGEIEIDPIGGYGFIPEGFVLEIHVNCATATKVAADYWWGKLE